MTKTTDCPRCATTGGELLWSNALLRVINVDDPMHPGFTRVVWQKHIAEMTQLSATARQELMEIGRASCRERVCHTCRSRWSPYHYKKKTKRSHINHDVYITMKQHKSR